MRYRAIAKLLGAILTAALLTTLSFGTSAQALTGPTVTTFSQDGLNVDLQGTGLSAVTNVLFDTTSAASFKVVSDTEVTVVAPVLPAGEHEISIVTSTGTIDTGFKFTMAPPAPEITNVTPASAPTTGGTKIVVTGLHFSLLTNVAIGGRPPKSDFLISDSEIDIVTEPHAAGTVDLAITTLGGTAFSKFTFTSGGVNTPPLTISSVTPNHGFIGGNTLVTISGTGFSSVKTVTFNGVEAKWFEIESSTQIVAVTPLVTTGGTGKVAVSNGSLSANTSWTYRFVNPWITNIDPDHSSFKKTSTVTIHGFGFTGVTNVFINGQPLKIVSLNDKTIVVQLPAHDKGKVELTIVNPAGTSNRAGFRFN